VRIFGVMAAIAGRLLGAIWGLAEYGPSTAWTRDPGVGGGHSYPWVQNLRPVVVPTALTAATVGVITPLLAAPRHAAAARQSQR
jgi:hypothetical protein